MSYCSIYSFPEEYDCEVFGSCEEPLSYEFDMVVVWKDNIRGVDEDIMKDIFGNHVTVKITADGATTDHYEHD